GNFDADILKYARQFAEADAVVIAAPFWDLSIPTLLKCYIENITASGVTFDYTVTGYKGLCRAKKLYFVTTSGGFRDPDFGYSYVSALAKEFYGIPETVCYAAEGLDLIGADIDAILARTLAEIDECEG
ncbi:MAG: NAD(P)H-dependent oxidoreductase, partial [Clostridia bacterium]|nr:NAD(P)H-dependent oxidoreductase [Clostridia bacterium]